MSSDSSSNIKRCKDCDITLISEEAITHSCRRTIEIWGIEGETWIGDGVCYYPLKFNNGSQQRKIQHYQKRGSNPILSNLLIA
ncbi:MAG: hypothetical protein ACREBU_07120, partial [Nitrososphaera sp.]